MKSGDRYFMAGVDLCSAKARIERILQSADEGLSPSMELMSACIDDLTSAMVKVARLQLSDPRHRPLTARCEAACGMEGEYRVCLNHAVDVEPHR